MLKRSELEDSSIVSLSTRTERRGLSNWDIANLMIKFFATLPQKIFPSAGFSFQST